MAEVCGLRRQGVNAIQEGSRCINLGSKCFILVSMRTKNSREERSAFVLQNAPNGLLLLLLVVARNQQTKGCYSDIYICFSREIGHACWVDCILKFIYFYVTNTWKCFSFFLYASCRMGVCTRLQTRLPRLEKRMDHTMSIVIATGIYFYATNTWKCFSFFCVCFVSNGRLHTFANAIAAA